MTSSEIWDEESAATYDADAAEKFAPDELDPTLDVLERLAAGGPALEFAIGTGRVGIPLASRRGAGQPGTSSADDPRTPVP